MLKNSVCNFQNIKTFYITANIFCSDVSKSQAKRLAKRNKMHPDNLKSIAETIEEETEDEDTSGEEESCDGELFLFIIFKNLS